MNTNLRVKGQGSRVKGKLKTQNSKLKTIFLLLTVHLSLFTITGCQQEAAQVKPDDITSHEQVQQKHSVAINRIEFDKSGSIAKVSVEGTGNITYTAFKLSEPFRLVIDIPDADTDKVKEPILVENEIISQITTAQYGKEQAGTRIGRVIIGLKNDADYRVDVSEGRLLVTLSAIAPSDAKAEEKKPSIESNEQVKKDVKETQDAAASSAKEVKKAEKITGIETIKKEKDLTQIIVFADGDIGSYNAFGLDDPSRLVLDIWGVGTNIADKNKEINIGGSHIKKVRVGEHRDKIRLVFESIPKNLPLYSVDVTGAAMTISYGKVEVKKTEPVPFAAVKQPNVGENKVSGIDFKPVASGAKLTITTLKKADYKLSKSLDGKGIVIDLKNVSISDELKKATDTSALDTSVASVSSFQTAGEASKDSRVLVKLKENALYDVFQDNNNIYLTFPMQAKAVQQIKEASSQKVAEPVQKQEKIEEIKPAASIALGSNAKIPANAAIEEKKAEEKTEAKTETRAAAVSAETQTPVDCKSEMPAPTYLCKKLSLDFKDADIGNILRLMAEVSGLNIITDEAVSGKVTLRLIDVPWHQAFDIVLKSKGLGKVQDANVVRIMPLSKIKQEEDAVVAAKKAKEKLEDLVTDMISVNYATAADMGARVKDVLSERGKVTVDDRTNTIIINDIPANVKKAVALIKSLDTPTPQVLIEARVVEAGNNFSRDLGIQWGAQISNVGNDQRYSVFGATSASGQTGVGGATGVNNFAVNLPVAATGAVGFTFGKLIGDPWTLDLKLTAAESAGMTKIISRPRIATLDNKEAKIQQGESIPFETTSASGTATTFVDANLSLTVKPHITADGSVSMVIKISNNAIGSFRSASGAPSIDKKEATTEVLVKDGETAVIGGIILNNKSDSVKGIPLFKDIPILGWLFKTKSISDIQKELLIFITPSILKELKEKVAERTAN